MDNVQIPYIDPYEPPYPGLEYPKPYGYNGVQGPLYGRSHSEEASTEGSKQTGRTDSS